MTDTFTIDDIKKAWANYWPSRVPKKRTVSGLIAELTRTKFNPVVGELVCGGLDGSGRHWVWAKQDKAAKWPDLRPVNSTEVPALKLAIEALEGLTKSSLIPFSSESKVEEFCQTTLAKIKELTGA